MTMDYSTQAAALIVFLTEKVFRCFLANTIRLIQSPLNCSSIHKTFIVITQSVVHQYTIILSLSSSKIMQ